MKLTLLVIRCRNLELSRLFYEGLDLKFIQEKHGKGPKHYSTEIDGVVLELYPDQDKYLTENVRLGFSSDTVKKGIYIDPDGRKVEIT